MFPAHSSSFDVTSLIDSGCSGKAFADHSLVAKYNINTQTLPHRRALRLADGNTVDYIEKYFVIDIAMGEHFETWIFFVTKLSPDTPVIFGLPWLRCHNPLIDWAGMSLSFTSQYCLANCCSQGNWEPVSAPVIHSADQLAHMPGQFPEITKSPSQLPDIFKPPSTITRRYQSPTVEDCTEDSVNTLTPQEVFDLCPPLKAFIYQKPLNDILYTVPDHVARPYRSPSVEDCDDESFGPNLNNDNADELHTPPMLTPGMNHYKTYSKNKATQAQIIPNRPNTRPQPIQKVAGQRRSCMKKPRNEPLPPLSVPVAELPTYDDERPNMDDIRWLNASSFVTFCRQDKVKAMRLTWDELDQLLEPPVDRLNSIRSFPTLREQDYKDILQGKGKVADALARMPSNLHDFVYDCYRPIHLRKISEADVTKFLAGKPELSDAAIRERIPSWLHDQLPAFLPRHADELPPRRAWDHKIELMPGKEPPYFKNRPLSPLEQQVVRKWLDENLSKGFIRESRSRSSAPLLLAAKPGGGVRICQDYRGLNNVTIKNRYPLPIVRETLDALCNAKVYTKLDIIAAFNKLRIAEGDEWKTAFITRFGLFESLVMPFGLCNAPASFQHYINHTLFDELDKFCTAYLDDVLIYSSDKEQHREHVRIVVKKLADAGLQIDINKCEFETTKTKYLGLIITTNGIEMDPEKVKSITTWERPLCMKDLQRFLGFANFYRRFIKDFSKICRPLYDLLRKDKGWSWTEEHDQAYQHLKLAFTTAPVLAYFDYTKKTVLETDASDWASGGVLSQYDDDGVLRPVAYFSAKHSAAECNYEIYDKELLAIIKSMEEWRPELQGSQQEFEILTDHKNLEYFTTTKALNQRQVRWSEFLSQYNFRIVYRPGNKAIRPDALSRRHEDRPSSSNPNDERLKNRERTLLPADKFDIDLYNELTSEVTLAPADLLVPMEDKPIDELVTDAYARSAMAADLILTVENPLATKWPKEYRQMMRVALQDCRVLEGKLYYRDKLWIPPDDELKVQIIYRTHSSGPAGHPGRTKTIDLLSRSYWWPQMHQEVAAYVQACELCKRTKSSKSAPPGFLKPLPVPFRAWSDISIDYITPLPDCKFYDSTFKHILVVVCRLTKMRHFIGTRSLNTDELVDAFVSRVYTLHGLPDNIISDRGTQFVSGFWTQLSERLGVTLRHSSAFHPETDGQTERINSVLEQYLRAFVNFHQDDWMEWLPLAEFASNNLVSETTGCSPFFANYGFNPHLGTEPSKPCPPDMTLAQKREFFKGNKTADRMERILEQLQALAKQAVATYEENANRHRSDSPRYIAGQQVYVNTKNMKTSRKAKKLDDKWVGPFVIEKAYPRSCLVKLPENVRIFPVFHHSLLIPAHDGTRFPAQRQINESESRTTRGRVLERDDGEVEPVQKWEFEGIMDNHDEDGHHYLIKWKHQAPTWQKASDLKGNEKVVAEYHHLHPEKPGPPAWVLQNPAAKEILVPSRAQAAAPVEPGLRRSTRERKVAARTMELRSVRFNDYAHVVTFDNSGFDNGTWIRRKD